MPARGLKIVGTGHVYHGAASPLLFKTVWRHRGYEFLECWNLVPFFPHICFQLLKSLWSSLTHFFLFNDRPNVFYRWEIWTAGRPILHPDSLHLSSLARRTQRPSFPTRMSNLDLSDHRTLFHFETVHFNFEKVQVPWPTGHDGASGPCSHMASLLHV